MADLKKIVEEVKELSVVELNDLVKMLEEEFGVSAAAMAVAAPAAGAAAPAAEEKSEFNVCATAVDAAQKIAPQYQQDAFNLCVLEIYRRLNYK